MLPWLYSNFSCFLVLPVVILTSTRQEGRRMERLLLVWQWLSLDDGPVSQTWGSTLVADGRVYMPTEKYLWVLKAGKTLEVQDRINLGSRFCASPLVANGTLYLAMAGGWLGAVGQGK
jgi:hypothetical protein